MTGLLFFSLIQKEFGWTLFNHETAAAINVILCNSTCSIL